MSAETIAEGLGGKPDSNGWICCCPAHNDQHASLSVSEANGVPLVHCHTGCSQDEVIEILKAMGLLGGGAFIPPNGTATLQP